MRMAETASPLSAHSSDTKEQVKDLGQAVKPKADEARHGTEKGLHTAASSVRSAGRRGSEAIDSLAMKTADKLDSAAEYLSGRRARSWPAQLPRVVDRNLEGFLVMAAATGFLLGVVISTKVQTHGAVKCSTLEFFLPGAE